MAQPPRLGRVARTRGSRGRDGDALYALSVVLSVASRHEPLLVYKSSRGRPEERRARQLTVAAAAICCESAQLAIRDGDTLESALALALGQSGSPATSRHEDQDEDEAGAAGRDRAAQLGPSAARGIAVAARLTRCCSASLLHSRRL